MPRAKRTVVMGPGYGSAAVYVVPVCRSEFETAPRKELGYFPEGGGPHGQQMQAPLMEDGLAVLEFSQAIQG